jgi:hypothetical protein
MTCRDCKLFDLEAAKDKAGRVQSSRVVPCLWQYGALPISLRCHSMPHPGYVTAKDGHHCPCFQKREGRE